MDNTKTALKLKDMLDISKRCTDSVSWHWSMAETSDLVFIMCWLFVKVAHIQENTALMASSWLGVIVGFCTSINQEKKGVMGNS